MNQKEYWTNDQLREAFRELYEEASLYNELEAIVVDFPDQELLKKHITKIVQRVESHCEWLEEQRNADSRAEA